MADEAHTLLVDRSGTTAVVRAPQFTVTVTHGPDQGASAASVDGKLTVGTADGVELRLTDRTVSRFHAEFVAAEEGIVLRDLGSTNGTVLGDIVVREVVLRRDSAIRFGHTRAEFTLAGKHAEIPTHGRTSFGAMIGACPAMRQVYDLLDRAAPTNAPVLITGESGTGKELAARALHQASGRRRGPFEVVDCGSLPPTLIESELFGHERGAFTNAIEERIGAFERAEGGTVFLDEIGELPLELQPKLLRAVGEREIRRIGARDPCTVDVRVVAATNRDLRRAVNAGHFRADVFFRLAVIHVHMPPLRERADDLPLLVRHLLEQIAEDRGIDAHIEPDRGLLETLGRHQWPGNVRELRNYLEQLLILRVAPELPPSPDPAAGDSADAVLGLGGLETLPLRLAKSRLVERFERQYVARLLDATGGNVAEAARRAGVDRGTLFRLLRRHGVKVER